ncbi:MAG: ASKHA domain-containing protein [Coriobacteriia bacterium]|nr:ASKHA domain-containing protein [Coriobacteriia bacterium]
MGDRTIRVRFEPGGFDADVAPGTTLLDAAHAAGASIDAPCGGAGRCGACRVRVTGEVSALTPEEADILGGASVAAGRRLACRARALGDAVIKLGRVRGRARVVTGSTSTGARAALTGTSGNAGAGPRRLGAAVDIGTTTVAVAIIDMTTGDVVASRGALNAQGAFGADVMSRVTAALDGAAAELRATVLEQVADLVADALDEIGSSADDLTEIAMCGNTAMTGIFLGRDLSPLAAAPYEGVDITGTAGTARALGLTAFDRAAAYVLPGISAFVGADITAGLLATRLDERTAPALFVDLGTNGEIVLAGAGRMRATSTAAGPALEGAAIECGMLAETGAIERVTLERDGLSLGVIGDTAPSGICGSGVLDLVAALLNAGVLDTSGRLLDVPGSLGARVAERGGQRVFELDPGREVVLTQKDVRQVQLAVAAVRTGIELLLADAGVRATDIGEVIVAGGFGFHVDAASVTRIGLLPAEWRDRITFVGNTALAGARLTLGDDAWRRRATTLVDRVRAIDLAAHPEFQDRFIAALEFPG